MNKRKSMGAKHSMCVQPAFLIGTYDEDGNVNFATQFDPVVYSGHYHSIGKHLGKIGDFIMED